MNGWKTWTGAIGGAACEVAKQVWPEYTPALSAMQALFVSCGVVGIGHKLDKASVEYIAPREGRA